MRVRYKKGEKEEKAFWKEVHPGLSLECTSKKVGEFFFCFCKFFVSFVR